MTWRRFVELALVLLLCASVFAEPEQSSSARSDAWERAKLIAPGKKVSVRLHNGKTVNGKLQSWSPEGLTVLTRDRVMEVGKSEIATIALVVGMSRGRRAMWAALIGGAAGAGVGGALCATGSGCDVPTAALAAGTAVSIGGIAAGIAALIPQHKEVIYATSPSLSSGASSAVSSTGGNGQAHASPTSVR